MRTSRNFQNMLRLFTEESERLRKNAHAAEQAETLYYFSHLHIYLCAICADIATATLSPAERALFLKQVEVCSSRMCTAVGEFHMKNFEKAKGDE